jgi:hypothetical protein
MSQHFYRRVPEGNGTEMVYYTLPVTPASPQQLAQINEPKDVPFAFTFSAHRVEKSCNQVC